VRAILAHLYRAFEYDDDDDDDRRRIKQIRATARLEGTVQRDGKERWGGVGRGGGRKPPEITALSASETKIPAKHHERPAQWSAAGLF
jgi:hypothetical protein